MNYPNAYVGVKRLFSARILSLIGGVAMFISLTFALVLKAFPENITKGEAAAGGGLAVLALTFMFIACIVLVISFILGMTGLSRGSVDEPLFRTALFAMLANIVIVGFSSMFTSMQNPFMASVMDSLSTIADLITFIYTIQGIRSLASKLDDKDMDERGNTIFKVLLCVVIIELIANIVVAIFHGVQAAAVVAGIIAVIGTVLTLVEYILVLVYLAKAKKMLANA